jgi:light-regulated signal transduction histidine kinase (bacteriophytochrome)
VDLNAVLATVTDALSQAVTETGAHIEAGCLPVVLGRRNLVVQLFENLIDNALKYRGEAPPQVAIRAFREDDRWVLSVSDNGIGFDPRYGDRIFRLFKRLHERGRYGGTGLGLAIARRAVERHGGRIWVESQPGRGSAFYFTLPALPT